MGANDAQTLRAFLEAEAYDGPSLIIAYSHCIAHGNDMRHGLDQQKKAVQSGYWPLYRYNPALARQARTRLRSIPRRPACRSSSTSTTKRATACWPERPGPRPSACCTWRSRMCTHRWHTYEELADAEQRHGK